MPKGNSNTFWQRLLGQQTNERKTTAPPSRPLVGSAATPRGRQSNIPIFVQSFMAEMVSMGLWRKYVPTLRQLVVFQEDAKAYVNDVVDLSVGTGHYIEIRASSTRTIQRADIRLNEFAGRINADRGGLQYALNNMAREMSITGALACESWLDRDLTMVQNIAHVQAEEIYPVYDKSRGRYIFWQRPRMIGQMDVYEKDLILMPLDTFHWGLVEGQGDTADPVPPLLSVLDSLAQNSEANKSVTRILKTFGLYGAIIGKVERPDPSQFDDGEADPAYLSELQRRVDAMVSVLQDGDGSGMYVYPVDPERPEAEFIDVKNISTSGAQNADSMKAQMKDRISTGLSIPGFMHGNPSGISDAYMRVIYPRLLDHINRFRFPIAYTMEKIVALDMALGGIPVKSLTWNWNANKNGYEDRDANAERLQAQADQMLYTLYGESIVPELAARRGLSPDEVLASIKTAPYERTLKVAALAAKAAANRPAPAQLQGASSQGETSTDKPRQDRPPKKAVFQFNKDRHAYTYIPETLHVHDADAHVFDDASAEADRIIALRRAEQDRRALESELAAASAKLLTGDE